MWDIRYRPLKFADVLGQEGHIQILKSRLSKGTALDTNYLFWGGPGQGKTTLARIHARAVICQRLDLNDPEPCNECDNCKGSLADSAGAIVEFDAASRGTVEYVRKVVDDLPFAVFGAKKRVYVIDECHRMSKDAQDVLLKPLEEKKLVGMFCTTEPEKVRGAIRSRCEEYAIRKVTRDDILVRMKMVLAAEKVEYQDDAVLTVIDFCGGGVRDTLNKLEMVAQMGPVTLESVREHLNLSAISLFYEILLRIPSATKEALGYIDQACERVTPEEVASGIAEAAMNSFRLANGMTADFTFADKELSQKAFQVYGGDRLIEVVKHFVNSRYVTKTGLICDVVTLARRLVAGAISAPVPMQMALPPMQMASVQVAQAPTTLPAPPTEVPVPLTPVIIEAPPAPVIIEATPPVVETPAPAETPPSAPSAPIQAPPPPPAPVQAAATAPPPLKYVPQPKGIGPDVRPDGVGPPGQDPCALGEYDSHVISTGFPANKHNKAPLHFDEHRLRDGRDPLPPSVWRREFHELLASLTRGATLRGEA